LEQAVILAAQHHDLGKKREVWQRSIGHRLPKNPTPDDWFAKSGKGMTSIELTSYRHEFGSLVDVHDPKQAYLADVQLLSEEMRDLVLHLIAAHHGYGRPHFTEVQTSDWGHSLAHTDAIAREVPRRFARLQRKYGRWGLAYLESLLRAADYAASARPSEFVENHQEIRP
jgi:CRISPR-associated endonuclease/helicase Cas3